MRPLLLLLCLFSARADIIDRIAVSVGDQVITEGQIIEDIRVAAFLNHKAPDLTTESKRDAAERLVEQTLVRRDMDFSHYPMPDTSKADPLLEPIRSSYSSQADFDSDLRKHGITEDELRLHLWWQLTFLQYVDYRFRPSVDVTNAEIQQYYDKAGKLPPLDQVRDKIEQILTQQHVDQAVDRWLGDARTQVDIIYRKEAFK